ncbi:MAG: aldose 1-epimerase [Novosphingobium sp.]|nr:aldose 1-epimerase [Novosphingobium sp.]
MDLSAGDYRLVLAPERGGSILRFDWRGEPLMRPVCGPSVLDVACFPLVPFSNRIAHGRFVAGGREVRLQPNFPGSDHPHPLHGFGWLSAWSVVSHDAGSAVLEHAHPGGEWPWSYRARQGFRLEAAGLTIALEVGNRSDTAMPAGLGLHPYFRRDAETRYRGLHRGEWHNTADCLPVRLDERPEPIDWWSGRPVGTHSVDTVYTERAGPLEIDWPSRGLGLTIMPSENLGFTCVYTPANEDFFCVEPVSHMTDAVNRDGPGTGLHWLAPGERFSAQVLFTARAARIS